LLLFLDGAELKDQRPDVTLIVDAAHGHPQDMHLRPYSGRRHRSVLSFMMHLSGPGFFCEVIADGDSEKASWIPHRPGAVSIALAKFKNARSA
jgi:hypothetical protein